MASVGLCQWAPLIVGAACVAPLAFVLVCKPSLGLGVLPLIKPKDLVEATIVVTAFVVLCFAVQPLWVFSWLEALKGGQHILPVAYSPLGWIPALALLRWRDPRAMLILTLACIPQNPGVSHTLALIFVASTWQQSATLALGQHVAWLVGLTLIETHTFDQWGHYARALDLVFIYLPAVVILMADKDRGYFSQGRTCESRNQNTKGR